MPSEKEKEGSELVSFLFLCSSFYFSLLFIRSLILIGELLTGKEGCLIKKKLFESELIMKIINWCKKLIAWATGISLSLIGVCFTIVKMMIGFLACFLLTISILSAVVFVKIKPDLDSCRQIAYDKIANMSEMDFNHSTSTMVYDKDDNVIGQIHSGYFDYVPIEEISMNIQNTYISQEDKRFKEHMGVDFISTARAGLALIKNSGEITQGGSTITQQVIKNTYLTQERSFKRKLIEIMLAPELEKKFSKAKIMEFYCNTNFYGNHCYGVEAASQYYFGKSADEVSIAEAALLAGISNSPSAYDPIKHPEKALEKRNSILERLKENGYLTEEELAAAKAEAISIVKKSGPKTEETYQSAYALHCAAIELLKEDNFSFKYMFENQEEYDSYMEKYNEAYNKKMDELRSGGYEIKTSFDPSIQSIVQTEIDETLKSYTELQENGKFAMQGAAVVFDNESGYAVAMVGGRGTEDEFNRAYLSARQPGSAIKPLIDYAPAFDIGLYYPSKIVVDREIENGPKNSGGRYFGPITVREAANRSLNTVAWQVLQDIGVNTGLGYLSEMEFHKISPIDNGVDALALGGFTYGTRVVDMAKGYQTLANDGLYTDKTCILEIRDAAGKNLLTSKRKHEKQVYSKDSAYLMTDVLKGTITKPYGTGRGLSLNNMPAAGKTGTTNNNKDAWFCGYTKYYSMAVWMGYDTPRTMPGVYGATYAGKIWKNTMNRIHEGLEPKDWEPSETIYESYYNSETGEPTEAQTRVKDLFSKALDEKSVAILHEREQEELKKKVEAQVSAYESTQIHSVEDTYMLNEKFDEQKNLLSGLDDSSEKESYYKRINETYKRLINTKNEMRNDIELYEKQQREKEEKEKFEKEKAAEESRKLLTQKVKENEVLRVIEQISKFSYNPNDNTLVNQAKEKLETIKEYDSYIGYCDKLTEAINRLETLPSYAEYQRNEALKEEEKKKQEEAEKAAKEEAAKRLEETIQNRTPDGPGTSYSRKR